MTPFTACVNVNLGSGTRAHCGSSLEHFWKQHSKWSLHCMRDQRNKMWPKSIAKQGYDLLLNRVIWLRCQSPGTRKIFPGRRVNTCFYKLRGVLFLLRSDIGARWLLSHRYLKEKISHEKCFVEPCNLIKVFFRNSRMGEKPISS